MNFFVSHSFDIMLALITVVVLRAFKSFESLLLMMMAYIAQAFMMHSCDLVSFYVCLVIGLANNKLEDLLKAFNLPCNPYTVMTYVEAMELYNAIKSGASPFLNNKAVIYGWLNNKTGKVYIGSASVFQVRTFFHVLEKFLNRNANQKNHVNVFLKEAILQDKLESFSLIVFKVVCNSIIITKKELLEQEQIYLDCIPKELQYNINPLATSSLGSKWTPEAIAQLKRVGKFNPHFGKKHSPAAIKKMQLANILSEVSVGVILTSSVGTVISFPSMAEAAVYMGVSYVAIRNHLKSKKALRNRHSNVWYTVSPSSASHSAPVSTN